MVTGKRTAASICPAHSANLKTNRHKYGADNLCRRCGRPRVRASHTYFSKELVDSWWQLEVLIQAWGLDLPAKRELVRVSSSGRIEVWKDGEWHDDEFTQLTDHQQRKLRELCWGSSSGCPTYRNLSEVPRLRRGMRFRISGTPEQDGLWACQNYDEQRLVARRILPDYYCKNEYYRIRNTPWPNLPHSSSSATEPSAEQPSPTETPTETSPPSKQSST